MSSKSIEQNPLAAQSYARRISLSYRGMEWIERSKLDVYDAIFVYADHAC